MRDPVYSGQFKRDVKQAQKRGKDMSKLKLMMDLLIKGQPLPVTSLDHPLRGQWRSFRDAHVEPDWLLIWKLDQQRRVVLLFIVQSETGAMTTAELAEKAVKELPALELIKFRRWFTEFDAAAWDAQIDVDAAADRLDAFAEEAMVEYRAGKAREI